MKSGFAPDVRGCELMRPGPRVFYFKPTPTPQLPNPTSPLPPPLGGRMGGVGEDAIHIT